MRDFIRLMQSAALQAEITDKERITEEDGETALGELRRQLQVQLTPGYQKVLEVVHQTHERMEDQKWTVLLQNGLILSYLNGHLWFNTHPLLCR